MRKATFSMQFSLAVKSKSTVAAGYLTVIRSFLDYINRSTNSTIFFRYFDSTEIPS